MIQLKITYGRVTSDGTGTPSAPYSGYGFETDTRRIVPVSGTWRGALFEPRPADLDFSETIPFWYDCAGATPANEYAGVAYYHVRAGQTFRTEPAPQCAYCGYTPPAPPALSCELVDAAALVQGDRVTLSVSGQRGALRYSLDDGLTTQSSPLFARLSAGTYVAKIIDLGTPDCWQEVTFTVMGAAGPLPELPAPVGAPATLELALRPIWETLTGLTPGALIRLELWVEGRHQQRDYARVLRVQKVVGRDGVVSFQLDTVLRELLSHEPPDAAETATTFVERAALNYFCRRKTIEPSTGLELDQLNLPLRTVLLAGLRGEGRFLTSQPEQKRLLAGQLERLHWLAPHQTPSTVVVRRTSVLLSGQRGSEDEPVDLLAGAAPARYRLLRVPVLPAGLLPAGVLRVEVQVLDADGTPLSEVRRYDLQRSAPAQLRQLAFANPFGGVDTLLLRGQGYKTLEVKSETAERARQAGEPATVATAWTWQLTAERRQRVATGWLTMAERRWLQGVMYARQLWQLHATAAAVPVLPTKRQLTYDEDERQAQGLVLEYELASEAANWEELR